MNEKRFQMLRQMVDKGTSDPFAHYALALEYSNGGRLDEALATFEGLRQIDPNYVPMYLMCGTLLQKAGRKDEAREWLSAGLTVARAKGDAHAASELEQALSG